MIKKLFSFWRKTKEQRAIKLALKLREVMIDLGYEKPPKNTAHRITIWEFDNGRITLEHCQTRIEIVCVKPNDC